MGTPKQKLGLRAASALAMGGACWAALRLGSVPQGRASGTAFAVLALSVLTYASLAGVGLVLARDGTRMWWLPAALCILALTDLAGTRSGVQNVLSTRVHPLVGSAFDAALVLAPAALLAQARRAWDQDLAGRLVPSVVVIAASLLLIMLVGQTGPDASLPVAVLTLTFGILSSRWGVRRAVLFAWLGLFLGRLAAGDITLGVADGSFPVPALLSEGWVDAVVALLAFAIAPVSRMLARRGSASAVVFTR